MYIRIEFYIMSIAGFQKHLTENAFTSHYIEYRQDKFMNFPLHITYLKNIIPDNFENDQNLVLLFRNLHYKGQFGSNKFSDMEVLVHFHNIFLHRVFCQELFLHNIVPFDNF